MSAEPKHITPGDFFLYFKNSKDHVGNINPFSYALKTPIYFAQGHKWKIAVVEMKCPWNPDYILCSNIVRECFIGDWEVRIISPLHRKDLVNGLPVTNALVPFYVSIDDQYVGVPITEIKFEVKEVKSGSVSCPSIQHGRHDTDISGLLHFKCE